jgi:hypothetical protein
MVKKTRTKRAMPLFKKRQTTDERAVDVTSKESLYICMGQDCCEKGCVRSLSIDELLHFRQSLWQGGSISVNSRRPKHLQRRCDQIKEHVRDACIPGDGYQTTKWVFIVHGHEVCEFAYQWMSLVPGSTLRTYKKRQVKKLRESGWKGGLPEQLRLQDAESRPKFATKLCASIEGWINVWSNTVGDQMPNENTIRVPFYRWNAVYGEYKTHKILAGELYASMKYFRQVWVHSIGARVTLEKSYSNFALCDTCLKLQDELCQCKSMGERKMICTKRAKHIDHQRAERKMYYAKRELAKAHPDLYLSIIMDKMDSFKRYNCFFLLL